VRNPSSAVIAVAADKTQASCSPVMAWSAYSRRDRLWLSACATLMVACWVRVGRLTVAPPPTCRVPPVPPLRSLISHSRRDIPASEAFDGERG
jgi:hypothetical protein